MQILCQREQIKDFFHFKNMGLKMHLRGFVVVTAKEYKYLDGREERLIMR